QPPAAAAPLLEALSAQVLALSGPPRDGAHHPRGRGPYLHPSRPRRQAEKGGVSSFMAISGKALTLIEWACSDDPPGMRTPTLYARSDHVHAPCHVGQPAVAQSITNCRSAPSGIQHDRSHTARL